jgi:hypothetical protein
VTYRILKASKALGESVNINRDLVREGTFNPVDMERLIEYPVSFASLSRRWREEGLHIFQFATSENRTEMLDMLHRLKSGGNDFMRVAPWFVSSPPSFPSNLLIFTPNQRRSPPLVKLMHNRRTRTFPLSIHMDVPTLRRTSFYPLTSLQASSVYEGSDNGYFEEFEGDC